MTNSTELKIIGIIQKNNYDAICFDTSYMSYVSALNRMTLYNYTIVVCERTVTNKETIFINLGKFLQLFSVHTSSEDLTDPENESLIAPTNIQTWSALLIEINKRINDSDFSKYLIYTSVPEKQYIKKGRDIFTIDTPFVSNMEYRPFTFSVNYSKQLDVGYTNINAPRIKNQLHRRVDLPDLVFSKKNNSIVDLRNTLISINGIVGLPMYDEEKDELYIKNGSHMLRDTKEADQNIVCIDLSSLLPDDPSITLLNKPLSECSPDVFLNKDEDRIKLYGNETGVLETFLNRDILFYQQATFSVRFAVKIEEDSPYNHIPLICLGGRLFMPGIDDITYFTINTEQGKHLIIEFHISMDELIKIFAANLQHAGVFFGFSTTARAAIGYVISNIFTNKKYNYNWSTDEWRAIEYSTKFDIPFISIIRTDKEIDFTVRKPLHTINDGELKFRKNSKGLLVNKQTRELLDYTKIDRGIDTIISTEPHTRLYLSKREGSAVHLNTDNSQIAHIGTIPGERINTFFPDDSKFEFSFLLDRRYIVMSTMTGKVYGRSQELPVEKDSNNEYKIYSWETVSRIDPNYKYHAPTKTMYTGTLTEPTYIAINNTEHNDPSNVNWYKVLKYYDRSLTWDAYISQVEIPDSLRYDRIAWEKDPVMFIDHRNRYRSSEFLRDEKNYCLVDILYGKTNELKIESILKQSSEDKNPEVPVYTTEYIEIKDRTFKVDPSISLSCAFEEDEDGKSVLSETKMLVAGLKDDDRDYNGYYTLSENKWYLDDSQFIFIEYDSTLNAWVLKDNTDQENIEFIMRSNELVDPTVPYADGLKWGVI